MLCVGCKTFSPQITKMYLGYILSLLVLFLNFYFKSYGGSKAPNGESAAVVLLFCRAVVVHELWGVWMGEMEVSSTTTRRYTHETGKKSKKA